MQNYIIENRRFKLTLSEDGRALGLVEKSSGAECLANESTKLFEVTQLRPFNNEIKLAHPNKRTTFRANRLEMHENQLRVGFEIIPYEAIIDVRVADDYIAFTLAGFESAREGGAGLAMDYPPVEEFRLLSLPMKERSAFGEWLNVSFDYETAVNVLAACPEALVDSERRDGYRLMYVDARRDIRLIGTTAALIACPTDELLDCIDSLERGFELPRGVESRRSEAINRSIYWTSDASPDNIDEHIRYAKAGGFEMMLLYYTAPFKSRGFASCGDYDFRDCYPNGIDSLREMLARVKSAGITPGLHFLHTHVGLDSSYVTPRADRRLRIKQRYTLARPLSDSPDETELYVDEPPELAPKFDGCRVLKFGGELISYESYTTERPYKFTGIVRGHRKTDLESHPEGQIGGVLDVSEYGASSCYLDQSSDLQEEIGAKLAEAYNAGFEFVYFDGSEGVNPPYEYHVPNAQYRVWRQLERTPLFAEGAAKAHFSWHMISGGNAFDVFPMSVFKAKIDEFPAEEAPRMRNDFTRVNFGWWSFNNETMPDIYEYGTAKALAHGCPATMMANLGAFRTNPRTDDVLEVMRRWELARSEGLLTESEKAQLRVPGREFALLRESDGSLKLYECRRVELSSELDSIVTVYSFERDGRGCALLWHRSGEGLLKLELGDAEARAYRESDGSPLNLGGGSLEVAARCVLETSLDEVSLARCLAAATLA